MPDAPSQETRWLTVVETREFQQRAATRMSDDERQACIAFLARHPDDGALMVGTGGLRKSRWGVGSRGKRGGVRIIYYYHNPTLPLFLLTVFAKNERDNLPQRERHLLRDAVAEIVRTYATRHPAERRR